jgi:hypothetical protein
MLNQTQKPIFKDLFGRKKSIIDLYTIILYIKFQEISTNWTFFTFFSFFLQNCGKINLY